MASNSFGHIFRITTWGESHGKAIGVVIDGCPAGLEINESEINEELGRRAPGQSPYTSPRKESDQAEIFSGVFEGKTTGAPISLIIPNHEANPEAYESIKHHLRPGHANYTYLEKYGIFDHRGGGRASARETACRVAAGAVAKKFLKVHEISLIAYLKKVGSIEAVVEPFFDFNQLREAIHKSVIFCPDSTAEEKMMAEILLAKSEGDSLGGAVEFLTSGLPSGLGDPVYEKLESNLAEALMGLPASKAFEIGSGVKAASMRGSEHNDGFKLNEQGQVVTATNYAGGILGGISLGMPLVGSVTFKPPSSIMKEQKTLNTEKEEVFFNLPKGSRHDPCLAIRAVPVVEAMIALVLVDALLLNRCAKL
jgi:chorismate synthase